jgi:predicted nucleotidyltransferase/plasmid maintenance system antidote protein VapI
MSKSSLGEKLRHLRLEQKLPLRKVAALLDIDVAILSKMERGERKLTKDIVLKLAGIYRHPPDELVVMFLSEKILYEIGAEEMATQALQMAEEEVRYKPLERKAPVADLKKQKIIDHFLSYFKSQNLVSRAWIFGSFARGDESLNSDIDVVIDVPQDRKFTFFDLSEVKEQLEKIANKKVDVVMLHGLRPAMKTRIEKDMFLIYEER